MPTKHIGDLLIALKTIQAIELSGQFDHCLLVADDRYRNLLAMSDCETETLFYPRLKLMSGSVLSKLKAFTGFLRQLRKQRYDCAIDLDGTIMSTRLASLCRARKIIGPSFSKRPKVYNQVVPIDTETQHKFYDYVCLLDALTIERPQPGYRRLQTDVTLEALANKLEQSVLDNPETRVVCLHPGSTKTYKQWGLDKFAQLADQLIEVGYCCVFIGAGKIDRESIATITELMQHTAINSCDRLTLPELVRLLHRADDYIGNDSGPMHLAAAIGSHTIGLFGPTDEVRWSPMGRHAQVVKGREGCANDCRRSYCSRAYRCLQSLEIQDVIESLSTAEST